MLRTPLLGPREACPAANFADIWLNNVVFSEVAGWKTRRQLNSIYSWVLDVPLTSLYSTDFFAFGNSVSCHVHVSNREIRSSRGSFPSLPGSPFYGVHSSTPGTSWGWRAMLRTISVNAAGVAGVAESRPPIFDLQGSSCVDDLPIF